MARIASIPRGLLSLLGVQNFGESPGELAGVVSPTVECMQPYLANRLAAIDIPGGANTPAGGFNTAANLAVPPGELWVVLAITAFATLEAGVTAQITPAVRVNGSSIAPTLTKPQAALASATISNGLALPEGLWLPSGSQLGVRFDSITGVPTAASTWNLHAIYASLKAGG